MEDGVSLNKTSNMTLYPNGWMKDDVTEYSNGKRYENHYDEQGRQTLYVDVYPADSGKLERVEHSVVYHADGSCTFTLDYSEDVPSVYEYDAQYVEENLLNRTNYCHCSECHKLSDEQQAQIDAATGAAG